MFRTIAKSLLCLLLISALSLTGCKKDAEVTTGTSPDSLITGDQGQTLLDQPTAQAAASIEANFTSADLTDTYDSPTATVNCSDTSAAIEGNGIQQNGSILEITAGGTYLLGGNYNGQILINVPETEKVQLVLSNFSITYAEGSPILCEQADKLILTLAKGTNNTVTDNGSGYIDVEDGEEDPNTRTAGAIHAKCALTVNGGGKLSVTSTYHNGIHTKKTLKIVDGDLTVEAPDDGVKGKNAVAIRGGNLTVISGEDGIQCSEEENTSHGYIWIEGGTVSITAEGDGIDASLYYIQKGGTVTVNAIGTERKVGSSSSTAGGMMRPGMGGTSSSSGYETNSDGYYKIDPKGVKAGSDITLSGGALTVNSTGHAVKSSGTITVSGDIALRIKAYCETYRANSKGISADSDVLISGGEVTIEYCYEGVESSEGTIYVTDGSVRVENAVDDGFNASGGATMMGGMMGGMMGRGSAESATDSSSDGSSATGIVFSGGYTYVNAGGDGLDSNSNIYVSGGTVIVAGPTNSGNGALDCGDAQNYIQVTGGILVAYGATGMAEAPDSSVTTQYTIAYNAGLSAGDILTVTDKNGDPVIAVEIASGKVGQHIVISCPDFEKDGKYTLSTGGTVEGKSTDGLYASPTSYSGGNELTTVTLSSTVTGTSGGMGGGFGGGGGGMMPGGMGGGGRPR